MHSWGSDVFLNLMATTQQLIEQGEILISKIKKKDIFKLGTLDETLAPPQLEKLATWIDDVYIHLHDTKYFEDFLIISWVINGERVSKERIIKIIELLKTFK